jgi:hypothetical protein
VVTASQQAGAERDGFQAALAEALRTGQFRVVIVLDRAPRELIELIGFFEVVAERLTIDLITVSKYDIGQSTILVPQRVDPERRKVEETSAALASGADGGHLASTPHRLGSGGLVTRPRVAEQLPRQEQ